MSTRPNEKVTNEELAPQDAPSFQQEAGCGLGRCRPRFLQVFDNIQSFTLAYSVSVCVTQSVTSYIKSQVTTLEKQFGFSSSVSGLLISCNEIGFLATTLFLSYITGRVNRPRALGFFSIVFGLSGLLASLPYFGVQSLIPSPPKDTDSATTAASSKFYQMCSNKTGDAGTSCQQGSGQVQNSVSVPDSWRFLAVGVIALSMIIQGVAKSPRLPYGVSFIDDNVPKSKTSLYLGVVMALSIFGPALAFTVGGAFSRIYVTLEETNMSTKDPRFIGAWWLGFVVFGLAAIVAGVPLLFFPNYLKSNKNSTTLKKPDKKSTEKIVSLNQLKEFLRSFCRLVSNPVYVFICLSVAFKIQSGTGMIGFMPKYLETQFNIQASTANLMMGSLSLGSSVVGTMLGGWLTSRLNISPVTCIKFVVVTTAISIVVAPLGIMTGCQNPEIQTGFELDSSGSQVTSRCVSDCQCNTDSYFPICGDDGRNYFSPCHAGCSVTDKLAFANCTCLPSNGTQTARGGLCPSNCNNLYPYLAVGFLLLFFTCLTIAGTYVVILRFVKEEDKALGVGLFTFNNSLLGFFLGPIIFGYLVDTACLKWTSTCSKLGSCALYDIELYRWRVHLLYSGIRGISLVCSLAALFFALRLEKRRSLQDIVLVVNSDQIQAQDATEEKSVEKALLA